MASAGEIAISPHLYRRMTYDRTPEAFRALIVADSKKFAQIIREVGIPMEG
jgi:hypothetical protein